jgi:hypothetical protein
LPCCSPVERRPPLLKAQHRSPHRTTSARQTSRLPGQTETRPPDHRTDPSNPTDHPPTPNRAAQRSRNNGRGGEVEVEDEVEVEVEVEVEYEVEVEVVLGRGGRQGAGAKQGREQWRG